MWKTIIQQLQCIAIYKYLVSLWYSDIRECFIGAHNCSQLCVELEGRYKCRCSDGYELADDQVTCKGMVYFLP